MTEKQDMGVVTQADKNLEILIADLRKYAGRPIGSLRIDMADVRSILALYDARLTNIQESEPCTCGEPDDPTGHDLSCPRVIDHLADAHRLASQADQGWIVSNGAGDKWRTWDVLGPVWTAHRDQATRYARRIDAENVHREDIDAWRIEPYLATHPQPSQKGFDATTRSCK